MANEYVPERSLEPKSPSKDYENKVETASDLEDKANEILDYVENNLAKLSLADVEKFVISVYDMKDDVRDMMESLNDYSLEDYYYGIKGCLADLERLLDEKESANGEKR